MRTLRILDLFSGAGGCAVGYHRAFTDAGYVVEITGVDCVPQPCYPFAFQQADAMTFPLGGYDFIHASPPCQDYSAGAHYGQKRSGKFPRLIDPIIHRLKQSKMHWIVENVMGASDDMPHRTTICGTSLGLRVQRHRLFVSSVLLFSPGPCRHKAYDVSVRCKKVEYLGAYTDTKTAKGQMVRRPLAAPLAVAKQAMGIDWMNGYELGEAIPPAYTEFLGRQIVNVIAQEAVA